MTDIFISYAREDRDRVAPIARALIAQGYNIWWGPTLDPAYRTEIEPQLKAAKCVFVIWSRHSANSRWVQEEAEFGLERNNLVLAEIERAAPEIPEKLCASLSADLIEWDGDRDAPRWMHIKDTLDRRMRGEKPKPWKGETASMRETSPGEKAFRSDVSFKATKSATTFTLFSILTNILFFAALISAPLIMVELPDAFRNETVAPLSMQAIFYDTASCWTNGNYSLSGTCSPKVGWKLSSLLLLVGLLSAATLIAAALAFAPPMKFTMRAVQTGAGFGIAALMAVFAWRTSLGTLGMSGIAWGAYMAVAGGALIALSNLLRMYRR
ncbi:MAG: toll/interleukin-1 receptor domain-containing protein [Pseudomonadota bacterium]